VGRLTGAGRPDARSKPAKRGRAPSVAHWDRCPDADAVDLLRILPYVDVTLAPRRR
jgi:hypothetical protein